MRTRRHEAAQAPQEDGASLAAPRAWSINLNGQQKNINKTQLAALLALYLRAYEKNNNPPNTASSARYNKAGIFFSAKLSFRQAEAKESSLSQIELESFTEKHMSEKLIPFLKTARRGKQGQPSKVPDFFRELFHQAQKGHKDQVLQPIRNQIQITEARIDKLEEEAGQIQRNHDKQDTTTNEKLLALHDLDEIFYGNIGQFYNDDGIRVHNLSDGQEVVPLDVWNMAEGEALLEYNASVQLTRDLLKDLRECENNLQSAKVELKQLSELLGDSMLSSSPPGQERKRVEKTLSLADPHEEGAAEYPYDPQGKKDGPDFESKKMENDTWTPLWARPQDNTFRDEPALESTRDPLSNLEKNTTPPMQSPSNASFFGGGRPLPAPDDYRPGKKRPLSAPDDDRPDNKRFR